MCLHTPCALHGGTMDGCGAVPEVLCQAPQLTGVSGSRSCQVFSLGVVEWLFEAISENHK